MTDADDHGEWYDAHHAIAQNKRQSAAERRDAAPALLGAAGVAYTTHNNGEHIVVTVPNAGVIDFWPSTGRWIRRWNKRREFGIDRLIAEWRQHNGNKS